MWVQYLSFFQTRLYAMKRISSLAVILITATQISACQNEQSSIPRSLGDNFQDHYSKDDLVSDLGSHRGRNYVGTIDNIRKHSTLRVLTSGNDFNYFIYKGEQKGFEYELAKDFVAHLNNKLGLTNKKGEIRLEMIPVRRDQLIPLLTQGYGDIAAAGLTATKERMSSVQFSRPYKHTKEVLVGRKSNRSIKSLSELAGKRIAVRKSSSYFESLHHANITLAEKSLPLIEVETVDEFLETIDIVELVSLGRFSYTIADSHIAELAASVFENIKVHKKVSFREKAKISWATPKNATGLLAQINSFLPKVREGTLLGNVRLKKYFENVGHIRNRFLDIERGQISPYDELFKLYGAKYDWDWRLLAALAFQESRFKQDVENKWGAIGLFQIKREVASEKYVGISEIKGNHNTENNIHAGTKYLAWLRDTYFDKPHIDEDDGVRLTLAAYNAGPGRLRKAIRLADKLGLDSNEWYKNVEYALLQMRKEEPVRYVSEINRRFLAYALLVPTE